jgi:hypothetical protein
MSFWTICPSQTAAFILCMGMLLFPASLVAQQPATADVLLARSVIGSGAVQSGGSVNLVGTIGQPVIGHAQAGGTNADLGFWPGIMKLPVGIGEFPSGIVQELDLAVFPVPVTGLATIQFRLNRECRVEARIYDVTGTPVARLGGDGSLPPGVHAVVWDGRDAAGQKAAPGVYFIRVEARGGSNSEPRIAVQPLLLLR